MFFLLFTIGALLFFIASILTEKEFYTFLAGVGGALIAISIISERPSAMDVYQGKTTLEITYKNGIAVDSTVVFKDGI